MNETKLSIICKVVSVPGPQGMQVGMQVLFQAEGQRSDDPAFLFVMLDQARQALTQEVVKAGAPKVILPGAQG